MAVDPAGNAVAIWERHVGGKLVVEASERPAGGEWSTPERVSRANEEGRESQVAIDDAGNAYAVWVEKGFSTTSVVRSAVRPPGGEWSVPENLSPPFQGPPEVVLAAAAGAVAAWTIDSGPERIVQAAVRPAGDGWEDPKDLCRMPAPDPGPQLAAVGDVGINAAGEAVAVWQCFDGSNKIVQAATYPAGGDWSEPEDLSAAGGDAHEPLVAIDPDGDAVATWNRWDSTASALIVQAAVRAAGDDWSAPEDLSEAHLSADPAPVAIDTAGNAVAVWRHPGDNINQAILQAAVHPAGGEWSAPEDLSAPGQRASNPAVAANDTVGAIATWQQSDDSASSTVVQASVRAPGADWSAPEDLSASGEGAGLPDLALDAAGNGIAVFGRAGDDGAFAQAAGYDFVGPRLDALQIPATGTAGEPVSFSASPLDMFLAGTSWAFGDGQGAGGNAVSHTYSTAGTYQVTVSAADGAGNTTTRTASILISPPPPGERCRIALSLAVEGKSLAKLMRTGKLGVDTTVSCAAKVALSGRAKLRIHAGGRGRTKLVPVFKRKVARFAAAGERGVTLSLSKRGRKALRPLSRVRLSIAGKASDDAGNIATATTARALQAGTNPLERRSRP
ncbi:MAG TPA: PKD domain-containing protein [Solirubrobacterales bacterium]|nr:PKD domain-containing protein [Solirubrobacterales bacterium]